MTPARFSESLMTRIDAPSGTVTRTLGASEPPHAIVPSAASAISATRPRLIAVSPRTSQSMLQQYRGGEGVDISAAFLRLAPELVHRSTGSSRREALVNELHGKPGALLE